MHDAGSYGSIDETLPAQRSAFGDALAHERTRRRMLRMAHLTPARRPCARERAKAQQIRTRFDIARTRYNLSDSAIFTGAYGEDADACGKALLAFLHDVASCPERVLAYLEEEMARLHEAELT